MTLERRVERLERENRWMRRIGAFACAIGAVVFLVAQAAAPPDLRARSLTIVDDSGKPCGRFMSLSAGTALVLESGDAKVQVAATSAGTAVTMCDGHGKAALELTSARDVTLHDAEGNKRAVLEIRGDQPRLRFFDADGKDRIVLRLVADSLTGLLVADPDGKARASCGVLAGGAPLIGTTDKDGNLRVLLGEVGEKPRANTFQLLDEEGAIVWEPK